MKSKGLALLFGVLAAFALAHPAAAVTLISAQEAALPAASTAVFATRGISLGPRIELVSPNSDAGTASPLAFKVVFTPHNQTTVDLGSVKVTYLKEKPVDLTARLKPYITAQGIDMTNADVPPGVHLIRVDLLDSEGKKGAAVLRLTVTGK